MRPPRLRCSLFVFVGGKTPNRLRRQGAPPCEKRGRFFIFTRFVIAGRGSNRLRRRQDAPHCPTQQDRADPPRVLTQCGLPWTSTPTNTQRVRDEIHGSYHVHCGRRNLFFILLSQSSKNDLWFLTSAVCRNEQMKAVRRLGRGDSRIARVSPTQQGRADSPRVLTQCGLPWTSTPTNTQRGRLEYFVCSTCLAGDEVWFFILLSQGSKKRFSLFRKRQFSALNFFGDS